MPPIEQRISPLPRRVWHVWRTDYREDTITAHECRLNGGAIAFYTHPTPDDTRPVLIRAYAEREWDQLKLVDTEYAPAGHLVDTGLAGVGI